MLRGYGIFIMAVQATSLLVAACLLPRLLRFRGAVPTAINRMPETDWSLDTP